MLFNIYDHEKGLGLIEESDRLIARIISFNTAGADEPELLKAFAIMARTE